ncbi:hypothetical protein ABZ733_21475 [Streptomyces longwoodensis]|uniref:hypothetical protein n=1 Tax=Streptomyces longwoodensis TaxID=68231 RepID=UPI0033D4024A
MPSMPSVPSMPPVVVYPPDERGGRRVRIDSEISGMAYGVRDVAEFLRRAGLEIDPSEVAQAAWIDWRGGGPDVWTH